MTIIVQEFGLEINPVTTDDLEAVLEMYKQCEDFLALGPVAIASMDMVLKDIELSKSECGIFCGIWNSDGRLIGVLDYVPSNYRGKPGDAYLELLMIGAPFRNLGYGKAIVEAFEAEIRKDPRVTTILAGVQANNPLAVKFWQRMGFRIISGPELMPDQTTAYGLRKDLDR